MELWTSCTTDHTKTNKLCIIYVFAGLTRGITLQYVTFILRPIGGSVWQRRRERRPLRLKQNIENSMPGCRRFSSSLPGCLAPLRQASRVNAKEQKKQIFATTHSKECIEYFSLALKELELEEEGRIIRLAETASGIKAYTNNYEQFENSLNADSELR